MAKDYAQPEIDYLAKDYASFRQVLIDHLSMWVPGWTEEHPADLSHALVEVLAYAADYLSYYQDAVASEAYLGTARLRRSVRRHVRLLNYAWHEGCNARVWVQVQVKDGSEPVPLPKATQLFTHLDSGGTRTVIQCDSPAYAEALARAPAIFETMVDSRLWSTQNKIGFYTGDAQKRLEEYYSYTATKHRVWLKKGATRAVLHDHDPPWQVGLMWKIAQAAQQVVVATGGYERVPPEQRQFYSWLLWLQVGHVLIFEEIRDPETGQEEGTDPKHRHAVRLTHVTRLPAQFLFRVESSKFQENLEHPTLSDAFQREFGRNGITLSDNVKVVKKAERGDEWRIEDKDTNKVYIVSRQGEALNISAPRIEIEWGADDALPFDLCLSASYDGINTVETSVALGNIVLADHGRTIEDEELPGLPRAGRYYPHLRHKGLTYSEPFHRGRAAIWSAQEMLSQEPHQAMPCLELRELGKARLELTPKNGQPLLPLEKHQGATFPVKHWVVRSELLGSGVFERDYAVEMEEDGRAYLSFGFLGVGWKPEVVGAPFVATYRIGNGAMGNVGREAIAHIVTDDKRIIGVRNPLPAQGGTDPISTEEARMDAPQACRELARGVTEADYARAAERHPEVARAVAQIRWTGSWRTMFIYVQRRGDRPVDGDFRRELGDFMQPFRLAGLDVEIQGARLVPLEIELYVHLRPGYQASIVRAALQQVFSHQALPDGTRGFFHADHWTFGQAVYQSQVIARAMAVPGVARVEVSRFRRRGAERDVIDPIPVGPLEIIQVHNDPDDASKGSTRFQLPSRQ